MPIALYSMPTHRDLINGNTTCTCGECPPLNISARSLVRIMFGVRQAMYDIKREVDRLDRHTLIDDIDTRCSYPYNWIPPRVREAHVGALIGAHNILLVVHVILQDGAIPNVSAIRDLCEKEAHQLPYTDEYIQGGGSVVHILEELTTQVEGDMRGDALHVDSEDLLETMEQARPCALDETLLGWRRAIGISE